METLFRKLCQTRTLLLAWKTVMQKGSSGGVDGVSIDEYDQDIGSHITQIQNELKSGDWKLCKNNEDAELLLKTCSDYLQNRLLLRLNDPVIGETKNGFEFLGVRLTNSSISISKEKQTKLEMRIRELSWVDTSFSKEGLKSLDGIHNYYAPLLPDYYLTLFDNILLGRLEEIIRSDWKVIKNKATLCMALKQICFFSEKNIMLNGQLKGDLVSLFLGEKSRETSESADEKNRKLIKSRKPSIEERRMPLQS